VTVAAVILAATAQSALFDASGRIAVRRIAEAAWAGGAIPVIVVAHDPDGAVAAALDGSGAVLAAPAPPEQGPVGQMVRGVQVAAEAVAETDAALIWPARLVWTDPETVTSLIEGHGVDPENVLRPTWDGRPGWPVLLPLDRLATLASLRADRMPDDLLTDLEAAGVPFRQLDLGDPGTVLDRDTAIDDLPAYDGPSEPAGGPPPEWGASVPDSAEEGPLRGPGMAPAGPAS
jgi:CTP:molybdopterin cytidylyltransferase MocA